MRHLFSISFLLITTFTIAQERKFPPPSESIQDSSLKMFLVQFKSAVQKKDTAFIYAMLSSNIKNDFGGSGGIKEFKKIWKLEKSNSSFWYYMNRVLSMSGCYTNSFSGDTSDYSIPYVFCVQPEKNEDVFSMALITGKDVALKQSPSLASKTLLMLNYNIVSFVSNTSGALRTKGKNEVGRPTWYQIQMPNGKKKIKGWVYYKYIYSPIDYRLILGKEAGKWLIQAFVAGD